MNIEQKKTALNDEADIYQKRKQTYTKEDIKGMSPKEKLLYFRDYYLFKTLIILVVVIAACVLIKDLVFDKTECKLYVACLNECMISDTAELTDKLDEYVFPDTEEEFANVVSYNQDNVQVNMSYNTQLMAGGIDLIICTYDDFLEGSKSGIYADIREVLSEEEYNKLKDKVLEAEMAVLDGNGEVISYTEPLPFGIDISDSTNYRKYNNTQEQVVLGVINGTKNLENAIKGIEYFLQ